MSQQVTLVINHQKQVRDVDGPIQLADLLNDFWKEVGKTENLITESEGGTVITPQQFFIVREDSNGARNIENRTTNGKTEVLPGDTVVQDRAHHNGR